MSNTIFKSSFGLLPGTSYRELYSRALLLFQKIKAKSKRIPYLRSKFFGKEKVLLDFLWIHIRQKNIKERARRLKYISCAFDLIQNSCCEPEIKQNPNRPNEIFYKFYGTSKEGEKFAVQIKRVKNKGNKHLLSFFPI